MAIQRINLLSSILGVSTDVLMILPNRVNSMTPKEYYGSGEKFKVLWLLHGGGGDAFEWVRYTNIERYACERNMAVVMPSAMGSAYSNWSREESFFPFPMFDFLTKELMPMVQNWFPISAKREDNFVAGFSMGGQGAMMYAFNNPDLFGAAAIIGVAPVNMRVPLDEVPNNPTGNKMLKAAARGELEDYLASYENTWERMADLVGMENAPRLLFGIGDHDISYHAWLELREFARKIGLKATFELRADYDHNYTFGDIYIQRAMDFFLANQ